MILKKLIGNARDDGHDIQDIVITCPAYFDQTAKQHTKEAGVLALGGTDESKVRIVTEPAAAALHYAKTNPASAGQTILVYDLGGGTFDVTVVRIASDRKKVEQVYVGGNPQLGGKDWDHRILKHYAREVGFEDSEINQQIWREHFKEFCLSLTGQNEDHALTLLRDITRWVEEDKRTLSRSSQARRTLRFGKRKLHRNFGKVLWEKIQVVSKAQSDP